MSHKLIPALETALQDYTMDQRGDIGSILRLEAISVLQEVAMQRERPASKVLNPSLQVLSTLAGEKLDKVRSAAWRCFSRLWKLLDDRYTSDWSGVSEQANESRESIEGVRCEDFGIDQITSRAYFTNLMTFLRFRNLRSSLLKGVVTSLSGGSEAVLAASRNAFSDFVGGLDRHQLAIFCQSFESLMRDNLYNERLVVPILESLTFLLDTNILQKSPDSIFR